MLHKKFTLLLFALCALHFSSKSQSCVTLTPLNPRIDDTLTITFNAALGGKGLMNYAGAIYVHSGLITATSASPTDWKYQVGNWGTDDQPALMQKVGENLYSKKIVIKDYFNLPASEEVKLMAFVFRDLSGNKVGKAFEDQDIFVPVSIKPSEQKKVFVNNYISHQVVNGVLEVKGENALIRIQAITKSIVKVAYFPAGIAQEDTTFSVVLKPTQVDVKFYESNDFMDFYTGEFTVRINKFPLRLGYRRMGKDNTPNTFFNDENGFYTELNSKGFRFAMQADEAFYGSGSRATDYNKRGQKFASYNTANYGYKIGAPTLNVNIPFLVSTSLYGIYFENFTAGYFDIGATDKNVLDYKVESGNLSYYLVNGNSFDEIVSNYTLLTGRQPLPPRWALGFIQSKYGYKSDKEALKIVEKLRKENFPIDGLVLDLYWFGSPQTMGNLDWDRKKFKHPELLIKKLDDMGVKLIPITETFIAKTSTNFDYLDKNKLLTKNKEGNSYIIQNFWAGPSGLLDIYNPEAREWMWKKYKSQIDMGIGGWWCDLGEPESHPEGMIHSLGNARYVHNIYSQFWAQLLADKYKQEYPNQRLFNLIRSGYAGMQRYSTFPWSGDIQRSYDGLRTQVQIMLSMGMSGVAYTHSDLGGFTGGPKNPELYTRWLQFGAFCPIMRAHGEGVPPEPIYYDKKYESIVRDYVKLRYSLLPYNYTLSCENTSSGIPIARAINFYEPENTSLNNICDEYFWGSEFLIAPVFTANSTQRKVIFPSGKWINFWNDSIYEGNSSATVYAPLEQMPIYVKAGSIIPTTPACMSTKFYKSDSLLVYVYPDASQVNSHFNMFEDDGVNPKSIENKAFETLDFSMEVKEAIEIKIKRGPETYASAPQQRCITYCIKRQQKSPKSVVLNQDANLELMSESQFKSSAKGAYFNAKEKALYVRFALAGKGEQRVKIIQ